MGCGIRERGLPFFGFSFPARSPAFKIEIRPFSLSFHPHICFGFKGKALIFFLNVESNRVYYIDMHQVDALHARKLVLGNVSLWYHEIFDRPSFCFSIIL